MEEKCKKLEKVFSCLPPVLIKRILTRDDVNGDIEIATQRLQESFSFPVPAGTGQEKSSIAAESKNFPEKEKRGRFVSHDEIPKEEGEVQEVRDLRTNSFDNNNLEQNGGYQGNRGQNIRQRGGFRGRPRGATRDGPRGGFAQSQSDNQRFRDNDMGLSQGWDFGGDEAFQPQRGFENRGGRGHPPKPKPKNRGRSIRGRNSNFQTPGGGFQHGDQYSYSDYQPQFTQRQRYPERGTGQQSQGRREFRGRNAAPLFPPDFADSNPVRHSARDDSLLGPFGGDDPLNRLDQGNRGRPNRGRGQRGMRCAQSLSSVTESGDQCAGTGANATEQARFQPNQLLVCGLSSSTTEDGVVNFIEAMSSEEVKEVMLRNDKALVTMANDITGKSS